MKTLENLLQQRRTIRVIGFDDAPFDPLHHTTVNVAGVVCATTLFEGMVWGAVQKDGEEATTVLSQLLLHSKFYDQVHLVLLDGIAVAGFNIINLPELSQRLQRPCISVMRKLPEMSAIKRALENLPQWEQRWKLLNQAGPIYQQGPFYFQSQGYAGSPETIGKILQRLTVHGHVPEALRLAHLIGSAVIRGQSGNRA